MVCYGRIFIRISTNALYVFIYASDMCWWKKNGFRKIPVLYYQAGKSDIYALSCTKYFYNPVYGWKSYGKCPSALQPPFPAIALVLLRPRFLPQKRARYLPLLFCGRKYCFYGECRRKASLKRYSFLSDVYPADQSVFEQYRYFLADAGITANYPGVRNGLSHQSRASLLGVLLGITQLPLPAPLPAVIVSGSACMAPVAMILTGFIIGGYPLRSLLSAGKSMSSLFTGCSYACSLCSACPVDPAGSGYPSVLICVMPLGLNTPWYWTWFPEGDKGRFCITHHSLLYFQIFNWHFCGKQALKICDWHIWSSIRITWVW